MKRWIHFESILLVLLLLIGAWFITRAIKTDAKLEKSEQAYKAEKEKSEKAQKELDLAMKEHYEQIAEILKERDAALEEVQRLEPAITKSDKKIEQLKVEYAKLEEAGASAEDRLKNALEQNKELETEVFTLKRQKAEALEAEKKATLALKSQEAITEGWRQKYLSEFKLRQVGEQVQEDCKNRVRVLELRGKLAGAGGVVLGFVTGFLIAK